jgi:mRNA interferase RelE/StbE
MSDPPPYTLSLSRRTENVLKKLNKSEAERIAKRLVWLRANAETIGHDMLVGQWRGYFRLRVGSYRIIYLIDHERRHIDVALIGHRRDVYD